MICDWKTAKVNNIIITIRFAIKYLFTFDRISDFFTFEKIVPWLQSTDKIPKPFPSKYMQSINQTRRLLICLTFWRLLLQLLLTHPLPKIKWSRNFFFYPSCQNIRIHLLSLLRIWTDYIILYIYKVPLNTHHITASPSSRSRVTDEIIHGLTLKLEATQMNTEKATLHQLFNGFSIESFNIFYIMQKY